MQLDLHGVALDPEQAGQTYSHPFFLSPWHGNLPRITDLSKNHVSIDFSIDFIFTLARTP